MKKDHYIMDSCQCLSKHKPRKIKGSKRDTYECKVCGCTSLGYDIWWI